MTTGISHTDVAVELARQITRDAYWSGDMCGWMGWDWRPTASGRPVPSYVSLGPDLGNGSAGIGIFLAEAAAASGDALILATARGALRMAEKISLLDPASDGFYRGYPGIGAALMMAGHTLSDSQLSDAGLAMLTEIQGTSDSPSFYDGTAGTIAGLLVGHAFCQDGTLLTKAAEMGHALIEKAEPHGDTLSWRSHPEQMHPNLLGMAHGTDGIASVLASLAAVTGESAFRDAALAALRYTAESFVPARRLWPDHRIGAGQSQLAAANAAHFPVAWEHGATGIALARLGLATSLPDREETDDELKAALDAVLAVTEPGLMETQDFSVAIGLAGQGEVLLEAALRIEQPGAADRAAQIAQYGAQNFVMNRFPWPTSAPNRGATPALLTGFAGIGRFYLRLADPARYPSLSMPPAIIPVEKEPPESSPQNPGLKDDEPPAETGHSGDVRAKKATKNKSRKRSRVAAKTKANPDADQSVSTEPKKPKKQPPDDSNQAQEDPDALAEKRSSRPRRPRTEPSKPRMPHQKEE